MAQQGENGSADRSKQVHNRWGKKEDEVYEERVDNVIKAVERND